MRSGSSHVANQKMFPHNVKIIRVLYSGKAIRKEEKSGIQSRHYFTLMVLCIRNVHVMRLITLLFHPYTIVLYYIHLNEKC